MISQLWEEAGVVLPSFVFLSVLPSGEKVETRCFCFILSEEEGAPYDDESSKHAACDMVLSFCLVVRIPKR